MEHKSKILHLLKLLYEKTDEMHPLTTNEIIEELSKIGISVARKKVASDIAMLEEFGIDIITIKSSQNKYYIGARKFELPEINLLIDAVESSKLITPKKSRILVEKISSMVSDYQSSELVSRVYIDERIKPYNEEIYYTIDCINEAIKLKKQIDFKYIDYNQNIGCGMLTTLLDKKRIELPKLDSYIKDNIPSGRNVRERAHRSHGKIDLEELKCYKNLNTKRAKESLGTLGGGNHFIEVDKDDKGNLYLVIHTGSRNLGKQVAEYYQKIAYESVGGRTQEEIPYELAPLTGEVLNNYLHDIKIMQKFASLNRKIIQEIILDGMKLKEQNSFETIHNYIDTDNMILRKGAVSAKKDEKLLIPINMRDGSLICTGLGNEDWNNSAPHGAGRKYSRKDVADRFTLSSFKKEMKNIFSTSITKNALDECPMAYKSMDYIVENISETVKVDKIIRPIYNFKASEF